MVRNIVVLGGSSHPQLTEYVATLQENLHGQLTGAQDYLQPPRHTACQGAARQVQGRRDAR
jgi:hypothetical protein